MIKKGHIICLKINAGIIAKKSTKVDFLFAFINNKNTMKEKLTKLSELQASLLIAGGIAILFLLGSAIGLFFGRPGLIIGVAVGTAAEFFYLWLISVGSTLALKEGKTALALLTYFARVIVFVGLFALLVILWYQLKIETFKFACWAMLIAFAPAVFITVAIQTMNKGKQNG